MNMGSFILYILQNEKGIAVDDRVALASLYLPDEKIFKYMEKLSAELCKAGDLYGLLVTGEFFSGFLLNIPNYPIFSC